MKIHCSKKQRGVVTVLVTIALPILLLIMGLALDFGHVFVNKTRLQNALDATALSAAIAINGDVTKDITAAETKAKDTFNRFKTASGNAELSDLNENALVFEYSKTLYPWNNFTPTKNDAFVFVRVTSTNMLNVTPVLIRVMNEFSDDIAVPAIATAGPVGQNCNLAPFVMCADIPDGDESKVDIDCSDGACYGYTLGTIRSLELSCREKFVEDQKDLCPYDSLESGNYNLLNIDGSQGGKDIREILQGTTNTCLQGDTLDTKPGWTWGNVRQGIDDRFDSDTDTTPYPKEDKKGDPIIYSPDSPYTQYNKKILDIDETNKGNYRRVMSTPMGNCRGLQNGSSTINKVGTGCVFLTEKAIHKGANKQINAEFIGSCPQNGVWNPDNPVLNGPYKIVLFKSTGSGDS